MSKESKANNIPGNGADRRFWGLAARNPILSFIVAVNALALIALLLVFLVSRPMTIEGKTLEQWGEALYKKRVEGYELEFWVGDRYFYEYRAKRVMRNLGDEGVIFLLSCLQYQESIIFDWIKKLPPKIQASIPLEPPEFRKNFRSRALQLLADMQSDILTDPQVLEIFRAIALGGGEGAHHAIIVWLKNSKDKQSVIDQVIEVYRDDDRFLFLQTLLIEANNIGFKVTLPVDFHTQWLKEGDDQQNYFKAAALYKISPDDYADLLNESLKKLISNLENRKAVYALMYTVWEIEDNVMSQQDKALLLATVWDRAKNSNVRACAALGLAQLEGEESKWWEMARELVSELPSSFRFNHTFEILLAIRLFGEDPKFNDRLNLYLESQNNMGLFNGYIDDKLLEACLDKGIEHRAILEVIRVELNAEFKDPMKGLKLAAKLKHPTEPIIDLLEKHSQSVDPDVRKYANLVLEKFSSIRSQ